MIKSQFTLMVPIDDEPDKYVLFNTRTQALIAVNSDVKNVLEKQIFDEDDFNGCCDVMRALLDNGLIVKDKQEDKSKIEAFFEQVETQSDIMPFEITLLTTLSCNFKCSYCFEEGVKKSIFLDTDKCDMVLKWIDNQVSKHLYKKLHITFYGGEPLLNKDAIDYVASRMNSYAIKNKIRFTFGMITNGYLLNANDVDRWIKLGLHGIRVTVDGDKESHDARRPLVNGGDTFGVIIKNIESIIDKKINISVTGNYDSTNVANIISLLDFFEKKNLLGKFERVGFTPLLPRFGKIDKAGDMELREYFDDHNKFSNDINMLIRRELLARNVKVPSGLGYMACSLLSRHNGVVIDPEGQIYKCPVMVGYPQFAVGNIDDYEYNQVFDDFIAIRAWKKCDQNCPYLPTCNGGCRFLSYVQNGNFDELWCERECIDAVATDLILADYKQARDF